jgi:hypothetical protein
MLRHFLYSFKNFSCHGPQQKWAIIVAWELNHQFMQAMLTTQIHVGVEFPVWNLCPFLYTREDKGRPYIIQTTQLNFEVNKKKCSFKMFLVIMFNLTSN